MNVGRESYIEIILCSNIMVFIVFLGSFFPPDFPPQITIKLDVDRIIVFMYV